MLTRIAIDNFRCFTDFELELDSINLLLGANGSGKTTVFLVLRKLQDFLAYQMPIQNTFFAFDRPRWQSEGKHQFELNFIHLGVQYSYRLGIGFDVDLSPFVESESLDINGQRVIDRHNSVVELKLPTEQNSYPLAQTQSSIASLPMSNGYTSISLFRQLIGNMIVVHPTPTLIEALTAEEHRFLEPSLKNFASWYRYISQDQGLVQELNIELRQVLPNFSHFAFVDFGRDAENKDRKGLTAHFSPTTPGGDTIRYSLNELSDGQQSLIAVYTLLFYAKQNQSLLCLDEPDNFLALAEIQPWLIYLYDLCTDGFMQAIIISHHPEMIDYLGHEAGIWLERKQNGPVHTRRLSEMDQDFSFPISKVIERGWLGG